MVMNQQRRVDQLNQRKQNAEWKRDAYTDFNTKLRAFRENFASALGAESMVRKSAFVDFSVNMPANNSLRVTGTANARGGTYNVRIDQVATAAEMRSAKMTTGPSGFSENVINRTAIGDIQSFAAGAFANENISFSINGVDFSFSSRDSLRTVMDTVNRSSAGVTMGYSQITDSITITSNQLGAHKGAVDPGSVAPTEPDALAEYNRQLAEFNADKRKTISFDDTSGFLTHIGMTEATAGQDAIVSINGSEVRTLDTNSLTLDGVTMTFVRATGAEGIDFSLEPNRQGAVDNIKNFVTTLNGLIAELFTAHTERPNRGFQPLTQMQRDEMSEREIERWEEEARKGLLHRDEELGRLLNGIRGLLSKSFGGAGNTLSSIGISTGRYALGQPFSLEIDEDKLMAALEEDSERVFSIFAEAATGGREGGFVMQLGSLIDTYTGNTRSFGIQNLNNNINNIDSRIKDQTRKLDQMTERYYVQYARMETMLSRMMEQQNSLMALFPMS